MFHLAPTNFANLLADRPAPRRAAGGAGGGPPCISKNTTFKIFKKRQLQGPNVTIFKISKKISHAFMLCWQGTYSGVKQQESCSILQFTPSTFMKHLKNWSKKLIQKIGPKNLDPKNSGPKIHRKFRSKKFESKHFGS